MYRAGGTCARPFLFVEGGRGGEIVEGALGKGSGKLAVCSGVCGGVDIVDMLVSLRPPLRLDLVPLVGFVGVVPFVLPLTFQPILILPFDILEVYRSDRIVVLWY